MSPSMEFSSHSRAHIKICSSGTSGSLNGFIDLHSSYFNTNSFHISLNLPLNNEKKANYKNYKINKISKL